MEILYARGGKRSRNVSEQIYRMQIDLCVIIHRTFWETQRNTILCICIVTPRFSNARRFGKTFLGIFHVNVHTPRVRVRRMAAVGQTILNCFFNSYKATVFSKFKLLLFFTENIQQNLYRQI